MKLFTITVLATQLSAVLAAPAAIQYDTRALVKPRSPHARFSLVATVTSTIVPSQTSAAPAEGGDGCLVYTSDRPAQGLGGGSG
ncbi:hypothetical protein CEP53_013044, partial [Fusarium sp. AF-6]